MPNLKNYTLTYNLGYVILDKNDPTKVLYRSPEPIFSPKLAWERCDLQTIDPVMHYESKGLTPDVVFIEGWKLIKKEGNLNEFIVYYQGCDAFMGAFKLSVTVQEDKPNPNGGDDMIKALIALGISLVGFLGLGVLVVVILIISSVVCVGLIVFLESPVYGGLFEKIFGGKVDKASNYGAIN